MRIKIICLFAIMILMSLSMLIAADMSHKSKYAGEEKREIKSLSEADIHELENGQGWGLAKVAELNGMPGPVHILEMKTEIDLDEKQVREIEALYSQMKRKAIPLGHELIELERVLNNHFANRTITDLLLAELLEKISSVKKDLRLVHLSTHLKTPNILTQDQIDEYNRLRGYSSDNPCKNIPKGHDPAMWKKHNNCP